ncbi:STAS domain-containing protein [Nonomuraea sp. NN258]|uniref:STAS domain-containing protein n=1 Tax=Nonomuraea antri TaxID=2730852 RepID=UPI001569B4D9|nr:STAS domain-containing protein [Nonomuraea antri]NRQ38128.1 STAS domain-containing protein [Nonomuraea antri]
MMQLSVRLVPIGPDTLVIALTGELGPTTRPVLAALLGPLPGSMVKHVVVCAADLWFCDMNGLAQLAATHRALQARGGRLAIAEAGPTLRRMIELTAAHGRPLLPLHDTVDDALGRPRDPAPPARRHLPRMRATH